jgi:hypothetical protein
VKARMTLDDYLACRTASAGAGMKTHLVTIDGRRNGIRCGSPGARGAATAFRSSVTCGSCLRLMAMDDRRARAREGES